MGNSASALPYSIDSTVDYTTRDGWSVSGGVKKSDGSPVTVFVAKKPALRSNNTLVIGNHHFVHAKKLRHPHLLQVYATLDTDAPGEDAATAATAAPTTPLTSQTGDYIIVTEPCTSLESWLKTNPSQEELVWALYCMVQALGFLHSSASLAHGNLSPESWKVTSSGDVKLWNYGIVTPSDVSSLFQQYEKQATPSSFRSPERQNGEYHVLKSCGIHSMDSYGLGILMRDVLFQRNGVPQTLQKALQRLIGANPKSRPRIVGLLKCPVFNSQYITLQQQLSELAIQPVEQKISFWQNINMMAGMSESVAVYKLLPLVQNNINTICSSESLLKQDLYKREVLSMLPVLFGIWERFSIPKHDFLPTIGRMMRIQDRAVRGALLQKMTLLEQQFSEKKKYELNTHVFEPMCSGFSDSSAALRELTLKSSLVLVPHLSPTNLEKLSRYLTRLQSDSEPSIRTNSMVLIIKVTPRLTAVQQEKLLLPSLQRGLSDSFDPCRLACLNAILQYPEFKPEEYANRVLPIVTPKLVDASADVRSKAFEVVHKSLGILKENHERMTREAAMNATTNGAAASATLTQPQQRPPLAASPATAVAPAPTSGGYLSGLSSWMSSSTKPQAADGGAGTTATGSIGAAVPTAISRPSGGAIRPTNLPQAPNSTPSMTPMTSKCASTSLNASSNNNDGWDDVDDNGDDGWGHDDDDDDHLFGMSSSPVKAAAPASSLMPQPNLNMQEEEDFFKTFEAKQVPLRSTGGKLAAPKPAAKKAAPPKITKLKVDASDWDDF
jgi:SCY1-like protein 1